MKQTSSSFTSDPAQEQPHSFASLLDRSYDRANFLAALKALIAASQERIRQEHLSGARGRNVVRHLTALVDDVIRTIWQYALQQESSHDEPCALVALGGYGRGELNPFSDIDLMFLCKSSPPEKLIRDTLYFLWDVGYSLGYSVRTRRDVVSMAESDMTSQTAMLEARLIEGDATLFQWLQEEICQRRFSTRRRRAFVQYKIEEWQQRYAKASNTVNLLEPNVKESPGGLRDYHTALWIGTASYQAGSLTALHEHDVLSSEAVPLVEAALDFLFQVRNALHYHYGRKNDLLAVDVQERLATALGFTATEKTLAVEHFLKTYYVHANVIARLGQTVIDSVTHQSQPRFWRFLRRSRSLEKGFLVRDGYLDHTAETVEKIFLDAPVVLFETFLYTQLHHHAILAPRLSRGIAASAHLVATEEMRKSTVLRDVFFRILAQPQAAATLRTMHRHGLLNAYIPEFAALTCLPQYDLYHRYTVDEHTLLAIEMLEKLGETRDPLLQPLAQLYRQTKDQALLKFAILLHDLGKDFGPSRASHVHRSGELAEVVCERLGLNEAQQHLVQILVVHHLAMNRLAQRRDLTDEKVSAELASMVETPQNLEQLYLLTFADTSAVGPGIWTAWKASLLAELYRRTLDYLIQQRPVIAPSDEELRQRLRPAILESIGSQATLPEVEHFLASIPARYCMATSPKQIASHILLTKQLRQQAIAMTVEHHPSACFSSVTLCLSERRGVFSLIAGALSRNHLNILGAQIFSSYDGFVLDTLQVETLEQTPVKDQKIWQQVENDLQNALNNEDYFEGNIKGNRSPLQERKLRVFAKPPRIVMNNTGSDTHTIIEIQVQDRLGLLYQLTHILYKQGLDIALAKISTEGSRAIDVFYVTNMTGQKIVDTTILEGIRQTLFDALA